MTVVRRLARPMLAATFVKGGLDSLRHPAARAEMAAPVIHALAEPLRLPDDPELLVRANGAAMVAAGTLLGLGRLPRLSAARPRRVPRSDDLRGARLLAGEGPGQARPRRPRTS